MKSLNKIGFSLLGAILASSGFAASDVENRLSELEKKVSEISAKTLWTIWDLT